MAKNFLDYQEVESDYSRKDQQENIQELIAQIKRFSKKVNKQKRRLKKVKKKIRGEKKILLEMQKSQNVSAKEEKFEKGSIAKDDKKQEKTFFDKVGDAFIKALPSIFRTVASVFVTVVLGHNLRWFEKRGKGRSKNGNSMDAYG